MSQSPGRRRPPSERVTLSFPGSTPGGAASPGPRPRSQATPAPAQGSASEAETLEAPDPVAAGRAAAAPPASGGLPREIGGYRVLGEIARGGMGVVLKALHPALEREVALKVHTAGQLASPKQRQRFELETKALSKLRHPGIVAVYDAGEHEGCPFLVMDLIEGESLEERIARAGPVPPRAAARLIRQLCVAMNYAHEQGILHRDLKPANVMLARGEGGVQPLLTDFGLAKHVDSREQGPTRSGQMLGTPQYMAPEQVANRGVDYRADVFGLGATLFACLTGEPPHDGETLFEVMASLEADPRGPASQRVGVPPELDAICLKCLARDPNQRYPSAEDLGDDLQRFLDGEPVGARPPGALALALRWAKRNTIVIAVGLLSTLLALNLVLLLVERERGDAAEERETIARRNYLNNRARVEIEREDWGHAISTLGQAIEVDADYPALFYNRGLVWWAQGKGERARRDFERAIELAAYGPYSGGQGKILQDGRSCLRSLQGGQPFRDLQRIPAQAPRSWSDHLRHAVGHWARTDFRTALEHADASVELFATAENLRMRAFLRWATGQRELALEDSRRATEVAPRDVNACMDYLGWLGRSDRDAEAREQGRRALELGGLSAASYAVVGRLHLEADPELALQACDHAIEIEPKHLDARLCRGILHMRAKRRAQARADLELFLERAPKDHPQRAEVARALQKLR